MGAPGKQTSHVMMWVVMEHVGQYDDRSSYPILSMETEELADQMVARLEEAKEQLEKRLNHCAKCGEEFEPLHRFCPYDATRKPNVEGDIEVILEGVGDPIKFTWNSSYGRGLPSWTVKGTPSLKSLAMVKVVEQAVEDGDE